MICACGRVATRRGKSLCHPCYEFKRRTGILELLPKKSIETRFFDKVMACEDPLECWIWIGAIRPGGYGVFRGSDRRVRPAHRWAFEYLRHQIPEGLVIDHLCRQPACVNPWHLEPVTLAVNTSRGDSPAAIVAREQVCVRGHKRDEVTRYKTKTQCLKCNRERYRERATSAEWRAERAAYERNRKANRRHELPERSDEERAEEQRRQGEKS